mgnify:CR=1 FL=1
MSHLASHDTCIPFDDGRPPDVYNFSIFHSCETFGDGTGWFFQQHRSFGEPLLIDFNEFSLVANGIDLSGIFGHELVDISHLAVGNPTGFGLFVDRAEKSGVESVETNPIVIFGLGCHLFVFGLVEIDTFETTEGPGTVGVKLLPNERYQFSFGGFGVLFGIFHFDLLDFQYSI